MVIRGVMPFSSFLKRTFENTDDYLRSLKREAVMAFRIPVKRTKEQQPPPPPESSGPFSAVEHQVNGGPAYLPHGKKQGVGVEEVDSRSTASLSCSADVTSENISADIRTDIMLSSAQNRFRAKLGQSTDLTQVGFVSGQLGSTTPLGMNIPAAAAAAGLFSACPSGNTAGTRMNVVDDPSCFERRLLVTQMIQQHSMQRLSVFNSPRYLWPRTNAAAAATEDNIKHIFSDLRRCLLDNSSSMSAVNDSRDFAGVRTMCDDREGAEAAAERASACDEVCTECQKVFKRKVYLQRHMEREHWLPAKVFKCEDCRYETKHQSNLSVHRRTHTGERPYHCGACGQRYTQGHLLKSHIRSRHAGNLRFYNLDKRSDSTRGRKSLDYKHDLYFCLQPAKKGSRGPPASFMPGSEVAPLSLIQPSGMFAQHQRHFAAYHSSFPIPNVNSAQRWAIPPCRSSEVKEEWMSNSSSSSRNISSCLAIDVDRPGISGDLPILSTLAGMPSFLPSVMDPSTNLPVFPQSKVLLRSSGARILSADNSAWSSKDAAKSAGFQSPAFAQISLGCQSEIEHSFFNRTEYFEKFQRGTVIQDFAEDLTLDRKTVITSDQQKDLPTTTDLQVAACFESAEETVMCHPSDRGRSFHPDFQIGHAEKAKRQPEAMTKLNESDGNACASEGHDFATSNQLSFSQDRRFVTQDFVAKKYQFKNNSEIIDDDDDNIPTDLSVLHKASSALDGHPAAPSPHQTTDDMADDMAKERCQQNNDVSYDDTGLDETKISEKRRTIPMSVSPPPPAAAAAAAAADAIPSCLERQTAVDAPPVSSSSKSESAAAAALEVCSHFRKLQKFRRIVFRFVNAFAPNTLRVSDDRFAETDMIDDVVHAAMFNDFE